MKALFPLDGSEASYRALRRGLELLAAHPELQPVALNVRQPGFEDAPEGSLQHFEEDEADEVFPTLASSMRCLQRAEAIAAELGVKLETRSVEGVPIDTILEEAKGFDVVVIHSLSKSNFRDMIRGSASEKIVRNCAASVLVVRA